MNRSLAAIGPSGRQNHIAALDFGKLFQKRSRCVAQSAPTHPLGQAFPQDVGQEADQDMSQDVIGLLVPDWSDLQFILLNTERSLGFG